MNQEKLFIVAGNREQYREWVKTNLTRFPNILLQNFVYVSGPEIFRGYSEVHGFYIGNYRERPDIEEIKNMIMIINMRKKIKTI
jgi:hypothetical protein